MKSPVFYKFWKFIPIPASFKTVANARLNLIRSYSVQKKMTTPEWEEDKQHRLALLIDERRKLYKIKDYVPVDEIDNWPSYVRKNKNIESKKHTLDDLSELKKNKFNESLNKKLAERVCLYKGDITKLEVDAIVNAANSMLRAGGGVDGAIHRAAGPHLQEECNTLGGCPTGEAKITGGYNLPAKYVIHTVGPQNGDPAMLQSCYKKCYALLKQNSIRTVAFPCISTGIYGFPNRLAAHIALRTARQALEADPDLDRVIFCTFMPIDVDIYETLLQIYFPLHPWNFGNDYLV